MTIKAKKFALIPRDYFELLQRVFETQEEAVVAASDSVGQDGQAIYVAEMKAVVARADRPVKVTKL